MAQTKDLDAKIQKMLALLERWKESRERNAHPDSPSMKRLMKETETLLKEAKEE